MGRYLHLVCKVLVDGLRDELVGGCAGLCVDRVEVVL
jgi:hypothetical protein